MSIDRSLYQGSLISLTSIDLEKDAEIISSWTHDVETMHLCDIQPVRPLSPWKLKKIFENLEKKAEDQRNLYLFAIRKLSDNRLIGVMKLDSIEFIHGAGKVKLVIGDSQDRHQGYGSEALRLVLHYAFSELNLHRLAAVIPDYNQTALEFLARSGFSEEVRQSQAINRFGQRWDLIFMGILKHEWQAGRCIV